MNVDLKFLLKMVTTDSHFPKFLMYWTLERLSAKTDIQLLIAAKVANLATLFNKLYSAIYEVLYRNRICRK